MNHALQTLALVLVAYWLGWEMAMGKVRKFMEGHDVVAKCCGTRRDGVSGEVVS